MSRESTPTSPVEAQTSPVAEPAGPSSPVATPVQTVPATLAEPPQDPDIPFDYLDFDALKVIRRLLEHGHQAYLVGGCVRDVLLGRTPKDFDIATSAHPNEVRAIFRNCRLIGRRFRLAHVYFKGGKIIEVSTFRANPTEVEEVEFVAPPETPGEATALSEPLDEGDEGGEEEGDESELAVDGTLGEGDLADSGLGDGAVQPGEPEIDAPSQVVSPEDEADEAGAEGVVSSGAILGASARDGSAGRSAEKPTEPEEEDLLITHDNVFGTAEQDARRRDFTINGLFYDVQAGKVIDYVRGQRDLRLRYIRTIGDPEIRMREDPVRILRAVRFASKLDLEIESRTYAAMEGAVEELPRCAPARLLEETFRLIRGGVAAPSIRLLEALGALRYLLPPIDAFFKSHGAAGEKTFYAYAEALDERVRGGETFEDALLLASLLLPIARAVPPAETPEGVESSRPLVAAEIEELLARLVQTARLPRRIAERCRMMLFAQRTLSGERRRRGSLASFRRHPLFKEALTLFEISVKATGDHADVLRTWQDGSFPKFEGGGRPGLPTRRRRRRRTGSGGGGGGGSNGGSP